MDNNLKLGGIGMNRNIHYSIEIMFNMLNQLMNNSTLDFVSIKTDFAYLTSIEFKKIDGENQSVKLIDNLRLDRENIPTSDIIYTISQLNTMTKLMTNIINKNKDLLSIQLELTLSTDLIRIVFVFNDGEIYENHGTFMANNCYFIK